MRLFFGRRVSPWLPIGIALVVGDLTGASAQPPAPSQEPVAPPNLPAPVNPQPSVPPAPAEPAAAEAGAVTPAAPATASPADYETRIRQLEEIVRRLQSQQAAGAAGRAPGAAGGGGAISGSPDPGTPVGRPGAATGGGPG